MRFLLCLLFCLMAGIAQAAPANKAYMSIIIDDLGQSPERDSRTLALPGPVTMAIMPDTPHATDFARQAHKAGKTVILHMPMDPATGPYAWHPGIAIEELGRRLARVARHVVYGERAIAPSGPTARTASRTPAGIRIAFDDVTGALATTGANGPIGFELCDAQARQCTYAEALLDGHDVVLRSPQPVPGARVRYCWADGPICTLRDRSGAPAGPFELSLDAAEIP